ncbi:ComEA family DNA-binding protein [Flavobacterium pectinovorum]|uniref:ComEA family DNA-binding protein n=1 Tax=Flavobacterium pectinovorum TaxID=29533 RepID=UPI001FABC158|nr:helix-hairpin-helix domain-containing protein [Flavobacterium pectinovorum]MCI9843416.1 helix-hairpin-helix domain-containing protein [Flavobacterium pectinovorum]
MKFRNTASYFSFTNQQRKGIFFLLIIIIGLQLFCFFSDFSQTEKNHPEKEQWLALQSEVDSLKAIKYNEKPKIYSFNPNFISDYKGYKLGMSVQEIDRLFAYRKENKYVNSAEEFQKVTKISDSLLAVISPYFKFPNWIQNKRNFKTYAKRYESKSFKKENIIVLDINQASKEDFMKINGIGEGLSQRILKQKESLEAFVSMEQINDVWGLSEEVVLELKKHFKISSFPKIKKIPVNDASLKELSQFPYFRYALAKQIVTYRSMKGDIKNIEDLINIKGFPVEKANIIGLYLEF